MFRKINNSSKGAVDLPSTMVGVTIIGLVGGVIAATVFVAIPWAQDNAAKQQLSSIAVAQAAYAGTTAPIAGFSITSINPNLVDKSAKYASLKQLTEKKLLKFNLQEGSETVSADGKICVAYDATKGTFEAAVKSDAGSVFTINSDNTQPVKAPNDSYNCLGKVGTDGTLQPGVALPAAMVSTWNTSLPGCTTITLPLSVDVKADVDWGDGIVSNSVSASPSHTYTGVLGEKTITVTGTFGKWGTSTTITQHCITKVTSWGETKTSDLSWGFYKASNLIEVKEIPTGVTDMNDMFNNAVKFNGDVSKWDTSNVTDMSSIFSKAKVFNQSLNSWDTSKVTDMSVMFSYASAFNSAMSKWDTSNVTNMNRMFEYAQEFNQPISAWDTSKVTNMSNMFEWADEFNQDISNWNVSNVTTMSSMFLFAADFNSDVSKWDTSKVTNMLGMFRFAYAFNGDISNWDTSNVRNMYGMFTNATTFNGDVSKWNTSNVTNMRSMFSSTYSFNRNISSWNTSKVTDMQDMFKSASVFNQNISSWDTSKVTNMRNMFSKTNNFNQNISGWNVASVTEWTDFKTEALALTLANTPAKFR